MEPNDFIREVAVALTRREDITDRDARTTLYKLAVALYWLLLREMPTGQLPHLMAWSRLRPQIVQLLEETVIALEPTLTARLIDAEAALQPIFAQFYATTMQIERPPQELLATTAVSGVSVQALFRRSGLTGLSPFGTQLMRLLERSILPLIMQNTEAATLASHIATPRTIGGKQQFLVTKGTVASSWRSRFRNITAAAMWALLTPNADRYAATSDKLITQWKWYAVLDPKTCPVCLPLDGTLAPAPDAFPHGAPPLHPNCRCVTLPIYV